MGHVILEKCLAVDREMIQAIMDWPVLTDVPTIRSFMGIMGYYKRFVEGFSALSYLIKSLQKKGVKFECTEKSQHNFEQLKLKLMTAPILKITDPTKEFVVCTDACAEGLGGVLLQENSVIAYEIGRAHV